MVLIYSSTLSRGLPSRVKTWLGQYKSSYITLVLVTFILRLAAALVDGSTGSCYQLLKCLGDIHPEVGCRAGSTGSCYQLLKALRRSTGSCKVVFKLFISHITRWVPGAFSRYDFYPFFFDVVMITRSEDPVYHDVKQER